jgi:hypothetical protein
LQVWAAFTVRGHTPPFFFDTSTAPFFNDEFSKYERKRAEYFDYVITMHQWERDRVGKKPKRVKEPVHPLQGKAHNINVNSHTYVAALHHGYLPYMTELFPTYYSDTNAASLHYFDLLQDGARPHTSDYTEEEMKKLGITSVSDWPPNSPDLNPIENFWFYVDVLQKRMLTPTREALKEAIRTIFKETLQKEYAKYIKSMPFRLLEVIMNAGDHTTF